METLSKFIMVRLTPSQLKRVKAAAKERGQTMSSYVRWVLVHVVPVKYPGVLLCEDEEVNYEPKK